MFQFIFAMSGDNFLILSDLFFILDVVVLLFILWASEKGVNGRRIMGLACRLGAILFWMPEFHIYEAGFSH
jgi:hypothetical protein